MTDVPEGWQLRGKPAALFRRFDLQRYADTRDFLDGVAAVCERLGVHPQNINFGTTYVNVTIEPAAGAELAEGEMSLARQISAEFSRYPLPQ